MADPEELVSPTCGKDDVDQDLLLARVLQEQERAFHALVSSSYRTGGSSLPSSSYYGAESPADDSEGDLDDEELAQRLQSKEHQQLYQLQQQPGVFLDFEFADEQDELDYDQLGYEDLNAIGDVVGKVSKGLQANVIKQLPVLQVQHVKQQQVQRGSGQGQMSQQQMAAKAFQASTMCAICQMEYDDSDSVKVLPCCHLYHQECVDQWLGLNKTCPVCNKEVAPNTNSISSARCSRLSKSSQKLTAATALTTLKTSAPAGAQMACYTADDTDTLP